MKEQIPYIITIGVLLIVIAIGATYIVTMNNNQPLVNNSNTNNKNSNDNKDEEQNNTINDNNNQNSNNDSKEDDSIKLSDNEIKKYLNYVPYLKATPVDTVYKDAYSGTHNQINTINKTILLYEAYYNTKEYRFSNWDDAPLIKNIEIEKGRHADGYYRVEDINSYLNKVFNISASVVPNEIKVPSRILFLQDDYYMAVGVAGAERYYKYTGSYDYSIENDSLIIYEDALFYFVDYSSIETPDNVTYKIYKNTDDMHNEVNAIGSFEYIYESEVDLSKYTDKELTKFKHVFKKNDSGYYWYSTEVV
ncbi:MAG: hypothetical protein K2J20_01615 [Bacilli bacterium]|nr:hypothetical protein [Bacilli bacterium]